MTLYDCPRTVGICDVRNRAALWRMVPDILQIFNLLAKFAEVFLYYENDST